MRIKYFGENKEEGTGRVAVIRFTDDEFDLYKYIENYEHTYGDEKRKFACGGIIGIERNEKGVWVNESYISVDNFTDFNDFKANYKEAKKEFKSLKKQTSDINHEVGGFVYDVVIHNMYGCDTYTVRADGLESAKDKAIKIMKDECLDEDYNSIDSVRIYEENSDDLLKEIIFESAETESKVSTEAETAKKREPETTEREKLSEEKLPDLNNFWKGIIKALGMTSAKEVRYTVQGVNVFFEYKGNMYKCYTPQSKLYKLSGQRFNLITWRGLKKESDKTDDNSVVIYTARPPP